MNYYPHNIGDYDSATAHLSWLEDMAYTRLIRLYYRTEKAIPVDITRACQLVRANTKAERQAVLMVLNEFFEVHDDGWHQKRCDEEIVKARESGEDNAARKENERERQRHYRERRKQLFDALRSHGIIPKWDTPIDQLVTLLSQHQLRNGHVAVTVTGALPVTDLQRLNNNQEPITNNQQPITEKSKDIPTSSGASPPVGIDAIFGPGIEFLKAKGFAEKPARSFLGQMRKDYGDSILCEVLAVAQREDATEPTAFIRASCEAKKNASGKRSKEPDFAKLNYKEGISSDGRF